MKTKYPFKSFAGSLSVLGLLVCVTAAADAARGAWQLSNRTHDLLARFDGVGLDLSSQQLGNDGWHLRIEFVGYGRRGALACPPITDLVGVSNRVEYCRGPVTEWWNNSPTGLEHGFTLDEPPAEGANTGPLRLALTLRDGLRAVVAKDRAQSVELADTTGAVVRYGGLKVWDAAGQALPAWLEVYANGQQVDIVIEDSHAHYPVTVDPTFTPVRKLTASDAAMYDAFGDSVSVSGNVLVVGAPGDDNWRGSAYVFQRHVGGSNTWSQVRKLVTSDGVPNEYSISVAVSGDVVVLGAVGSVSGGDEGKGYVFERNAGGSNNWGEIQRLAASDGGPANEFGLSVAASGDFVLVGAPGDNDRRGSAYLFQRNRDGGNTWSQVKKLIASDGGPNDGFGVSVAVSENVVVVGAFQDEVGGNIGQGSGYVFERDGGGSNNWGQVQKLIASDGTESASFGRSVSVSGDVAVVGRGDEFSAYVFQRNAGGSSNWGQVRKLITSGGVHFGRVAVCVSGDLIVIEQEGGFLPHVFERNAGGANNWGQTQQLSVGGDEVSYWSSVSASGDLVVVGAPADDNNRGAAYLFDRNTTAYPPSILQNPQSQTNLVGATANLEVIAFGEPLWNKDGVALTNGGRVSGATSANLSLTNVQASDSGAYSVVVTNLYGSATSRVAVLTVIDLGAPVEATNLVWTSGGNATWSSESVTDRDSMDAARSGRLFDGQESWLQTIVTGPGTLAFWWKVSSEMDYDMLEFSIDDVVQRRISGEENWEQLSMAIGAGNHTLQWRYFKDGSTAFGQDAGWLDEVVYLRDSGPPVVLAQPVSRIAGLGDTVTLLAGTGGATPRIHQWFKNDIAIAGASNAFLTLSNIDLAAVGSYHLSVTNPFGSRRSSTIELAVTTNGLITTVLLFADEPSTSPYRTALANLGATYVLFTDPNAFGIAVGSADPATTLVVVGNLRWAISLNSVGRFANSGGRTILHDSFLIPGSILAPAFNSRIVQQVRSTPLPVHNWGSPFFTGLSSPILMTKRYNASGQTLQPTAEGQAVAGYVMSPVADQAAMVLGHSGRTVLNGFNLEEISVSSAAVLLAQNQIGHYLRESGLTNLAVRQSLVRQFVAVGGAVTFSVSVSGHPPPFGYEWRHTTTGTLLASNVSTERAAFFTLSNAQPSHNGIYKVTIRNLASPDGVSSFGNLMVQPDSDGDGLPDVWEALNPEASDPTMDNDDDGVRNLGEYVAGTNPTNANSVLRIDGITAGSLVTLDFQAASNKTYTVQYTGALGSDAWSRLVDVVARATNHLESVTDSRSSGNRFYRLVTPRVP